MGLPLRVSTYEEEPVVVRTRSTRRVRKHGRVVRRLAGVGILCASLLLLCLAGVGAVTIIGGMCATGELPLQSASAGSHLSASVGSVKRSSGYITVTGNVANINARNAKDLEAIVELLDKNGRTVQSSESMVTIAHLKAGESSPFTVIVNDDAAATGYRVVIRHAGGAEIE